MRLTLVVSMLLSLAMIGCAEDEARPLTQKPRISPKPLPECEELVTVEVQTEKTPLALKREFRIGYRPGIPSWTFSLGQGDVVAPLRLERGIEYHVSINTTRLDRVADYQSYTLYVPTCEERGEYQRENPSYEEPISLVR